MSKLAAAVLRFPERELEIHRLCVRDPEFVAVCEDFADAQAAFEHWQAVSVRAQGRVEEYRVLVEELASAITAALDRQPCARPGSGA